MDQKEDDKQPPDKNIEHFRNNPNRGRGRDVQDPNTLKADKYQEKTKIQIKAGRLSSVAALCNGQGLKGGI